MAKPVVVVGVFDDMSEVQRVVTELVDSGTLRDEISVLAGKDEGEAVATDADTKTVKKDTVPRAAEGAGIGAATGLFAGLAALAIPGVGPILAIGPLAAALGGAGIGAAAGGLIGGLTSVGVPEESAQNYAEALRRGSILVAVRVPDDRAQQVTDIMNREGAVDVDQRAERWERTSRHKRFDPAAAPLTREQRGRERELNVRHYDQGEKVVPVVEEEVKIGKRPVQRGGVRVYTHVTEQPVREEVKLREERINVERHPVDRPVTNTDLSAMREGTIEVTAQGEEAVVAKQARVVEEVVVSKEVGERVQTVSETARRADVKVEPIGAKEGPITGSRAFETYDADFQRDYQSTLGRSGLSYDYYVPAYRYGYTAANDPRYSGRTWDTIDADLQRDWEARQPGTWQQIKSAVRYAWERSRGKTS